MNSMLLAHTRFQTHADMHKCGSMIHQTSSDISLLYATIHALPHSAPPRYQRCRQRVIVIFADCIIANLCLYLNNCLSP